MTVGLWPGIVSSLEGVTIPANIGDSAYGGYYAGIIDTTRSGSIDADDYYQTGARYLLIVSPRSLETARAWRGGSDTIGAQAKTRWNGLGVTEALASTFPTRALAYCHDLSYPNDFGSRWYLPAIDEMELLYRHFKPTTNGNNSGPNSSNIWPWPTGVAVSGENLSSDPTGSAYPSQLNPAQTSLSIFQSPGGSERIFGSGGVNTGQYWTSSSPANSPWTLLMSIGAAISSNGDATMVVRPVRRVLL
jgi:hypothetical protein